MGITLSKADVTILDLNLSQGGCKRIRDKDQDQNIALTPNIPLYDDESLTCQTPPIDTNCPTIPQAADVEVEDLRHQAPNASHFPHERVKEQALT